MMKYSKYNSCKNDFIIIDNRQLLFPLNGGKWTKYPLNQEDSAQLYIKSLCDRDYGIGADGLILLSIPPKGSNCLYHMSYFNSDGRLSSFCGNGSMCCAHFASTLGISSSDKNSSGYFHTNEGVFYFESNVHNFNTKISLVDVQDFSIDDHGIFINTGSPHYVIFKHKIDKLNVHEAGRKIRYSQRFEKEGVNVTFASFVNKKLSIRTYERGVESETLSCGTGAVAAALSASIYKFTLDKHILVHTKGGILNVSFDNQIDNFSNIYLESVVEKNFEGILPTE